MFYLIIKLSNKLFSPSSFPDNLLLQPTSGPCGPSRYLRRAGLTHTRRRRQIISVGFLSHCTHIPLKRRQDDPERIRGKWSWPALKHSHVISDISRRELRTCYYQHKIIIYNSQGRQYRSLWINIYVVTVHWFLSFATKFVYRWEKLSLGLLDH